jgi:hypothetical protein
MLNVICITKQNIFPVVTILQDLASVVGAVLYFVSLATWLPKSLHFALIICDVTGWQACRSFIVASRQT